LSTALSTDFIISRQLDYIRTAIYTYCKSRLGYPKGSNWHNACFSFANWKFADDSTISEVIPRTENDNLQDTVDHVANWSNNNKFQLNPAKCKELRIKFTKDPCRADPKKVNDQHFEVITSAKILGMTITDDLKWKAHSKYSIESFKTTLSSETIEACGR
jgi:hypothetical protein